MTSMSYTCSFAFIAAVVGFGVAVADAPLAPPPTIVCSLSGKICASREAQVQSVVIWKRLPQAGRRNLWRAPISLANAQVADDGKSLVAAYPGANLLDADATLATPMLTFYRPGQSPVVITLGQIVTDPSVLPKTVSHRLWVRAYGYNARGDYVVNTVDGRQLIYNPANGHPIELTRK